MIVASLTVVTISWLTFSIHYRQCQPSSKFLVLHTIPGLLVMVGGLALHSLQQSVTSQCLVHLTTGVAIMILLPSSVRNFQGLSLLYLLHLRARIKLIFPDKTAGKEMTSSVSVSSSLSVPGSAVRKGNKKPRKDVSVSFKQVEVLEEEEEEEDRGRDKQNGKMNGNSEVKEEHDKEEKDISKDDNEANIDNNTQL